MHVHSGANESTTLHVLHVEANLAFWSALQFNHALITYLLARNKAQMVCT